MEVVSLTYEGETEKCSENRSYPLGAIHASKTK